MRSLVLPAAFGVVVLALAAVVAVIVGWGGDVPEEVRPIVVEEPGDGESPGVEAEGRGGPTPDGAGSGEGDDRHEEGAIEGTAVTNRKRPTEWTRRGPLVTMTPRKTAEPRWGLRS